MELVASAHAAEGKTTYESKQNFTNLQSIVNSTAILLQGNLEKRGEISAAEQLNRLMKQQLALNQLHDIVQRTRMFVYVCEFTDTDFCND